MPRALWTGHKHRRGLRPRGRRKTFPVLVQRYFVVYTCSGVSSRLATSRVRLSATGRSALSRRRPHAGCNSPRVEFVLASPHLDELQCRRVSSSLCKLDARMASTAILVRRNRALTRPGRSNPSLCQMFFCRCDLWQHREQGEVASLSKTTPESLKLP